MPRMPKMIMITIMTARPLKNNLKIGSYNSHGMGVGRVEYISQLLKIVDILLIQEHWLLKEQFPAFESKFPAAHVFAVSGMNSAVLTSGRPFGGCAILVNSNLPVIISPIEVQSNRACGITVDVNGSELLIFNVYMPCDTETDSHNVEEFNIILCEIKSMCELTNAELIIIGGDFNTSFKRIRSLHTASLMSFVNENGLVCGSDHPVSNVDFTFESKIDGTRSVLDHFLFSESLARNLTSYCVTDSGENMSDHVALTAEIKIDLTHSETDESESKRHGVRWATATANDMELYKAMLEHKLLCIEFPHDIVECQYFNCQEHLDSLSDLYERVCRACVESSVHLVKSNKRKRPIAGWSEHVQGYKDSALLWHRIWKEMEVPQKNTIWH